MGSVIRYLRTYLYPLLLGVGGTMALGVALIGGEAALSTTAFCTSCHSMSYPAEELRESGHYRVLGADPACKDCHIPQGLSNFHLAVWAHVVDGSRDLIAEWTGDYSTKKKFNERRLEMAHAARLGMKARDSITCRACHKDPRPPVEAGKTAHKKMKTEGATCIDCHQNLVHREVEETDLDASLIQGKMVIRNAQ
jgi:nitrate/TMAO reductase-like tetraheme cytochrome c subunit